MQTRRGTGRPRAAAATVEMAVFAPFLILLIVIGVDFARVYYFHVTITNAARSGAVYASSHPDKVADTAGISQIVAADTVNLSPAATVTSASGTYTDGIPWVSVTVSWDFNTVVAYPGVPRPLHLVRTVEMRVAPANPTEPVAGG